MAGIAWDDSLDLLMGLQLCLSMQRFLGSSAVPPFCPAWCCGTITIYLQFSKPILQSRFWQILEMEYVFPNTSLKSVEDLMFYHYKSMPCSLNWCGFYYKAFLCCYRLQVHEAC